MVTKCVQLFCVAVVFIAVYFPTRHARHYDYIALDKVYTEIVLKTAHNVVRELPACTYQSIILNNTEILVSEINKPQHFITPLPGGEYVPSQCTPLIKSAIVVPYRNRTDQLDTFIKFMHTFLQRQRIHYRIIVAEQNDNLPFNRGKMINFGARFALDLNYTCLILHDVDLIPLTTGNLYGCTRRPRHMSSSLDTFRYNLPYLTLFGGAIAILSEHYKKVNGMSNSFYGWGGEDDDFYNRLEAHHLFPYRFAPELSKYTMLVHKKQAKNNNRLEKLKHSIENMDDGLDDLGRLQYSVYKEDLFTRVVPVT